MISMMSLLCWDEDIKKAARRDLTCSLWTECIWKRSGSVFVIASQITITFGKSNSNNNMQIRNYGLPCRFTPLFDVVVDYSTVLKRCQDGFEKFFEKLRNCDGSETLYGTVA